MVNDHPTYPNPIIQEAICEIHFHLTDEAEWKPVLFGELFKRLQSDFPIFEPAPQMTMQLNFGQGGIGRIITPQQRMRYRHATRPLLLQLSDGILAVNLLAKYPGWSQMKSDILRAWADLGEVAQPEAISRIGLRYINKIARTTAHEQPGAWLLPSQYIPSAAMTSLSGFLSRLEIRVDADNRLIITLGESSDKPDDVPPSIVLDIDCLVEKPIRVDSVSVSQEIERLHSIVWSVFKASLTPRLENFMREESI